MAFIVSARKYRPAKFRDVVGQKTVTTTLKNAIQSDKLAQSFLFCGPRGVGKTTCARILAKVINCENLSKDTEPCGECSSCTSFDHSASFNIFELDAASNNSVEDIRNLIEQVRFAPQAGRFKVYIIDEVHMLSQAAFNAFLKTLEEPPNYAIFILATTEKHKIIPTILSRCQIFDFSRITVGDMVEHLQYIAKDQAIDADPDALHLIAQKADGGLRDSLSMFDRIASFSEGKVAYQNVVDALSILDYDYFFKVTDYLLTQDTTNTLLIFNDILQKGFEGDNFIGGLSAHFRNLLVCKNPETLQLLDVTDGIRKRYEEQANLAPSSFLLSALNVANQCDIHYRTAKNKRLHVELCLLKMCFINQTIHLAKTPQVITATAAVATSVAPEKKKLADNNVVNNNYDTPSNSTVNSPINTPKQAIAPEQETTSSTNNTPANPAIEKEEELETLSNVEENENTTVNTERVAEVEVAEDAVTATNAADTNFLAVAKKKRKGEKLTGIAKLRQQKKEKEAAEAAKQAAEDIALMEGEVVEISEEELLKHWKAFTPSVAQESVKTIFEQAIPQIKEEMIIVPLSSDFHKDLARNDLSHFVGYLRKQTGANNLGIEAIIDKSLRKEVKPQTKAFLPSDRFKEMAKKNPKLLELAEKLKLQLDY